jgi:hypothetical protein
LASGGQLLDLLIAAHTFLTQTPAGKASNLFIVVTMRTEELHRVGEYPALTLPEELLNSRHSVTLADVVTSSFYLIQVMDPDQDREDLKAAIVQPAREVLEDYNLLDAGHADAPFDDGVVDWLLDGAKLWRDAEGQGHKADQLPLLQHALRVMWESALKRWGSTLEAGQMPAMLITREDLPQEHSDERAPQDADIAYCLDARADRASIDAHQKFDKAIESGKKTAHSAEAGNAAMRAAIRALARRDDRGNWARRFASIEAMDAFMAIDPDTALLPQKKRRQALTEALLVLKADGYLSEGQNRDYDISHEALIRNWGTALIWLREPTDTALAIERVLKDVEPWLIGHPGKANSLRELMPRQLVDRLAPIEDPASPLAPTKPMVCLPAEWSKEQIRLVVGTRGERGGWGSEDAALNKLRDARRQVIEERRRWEDREIARQLWQRRLWIGLPVFAFLFVGFATLAVLALLRYQDTKEVAVGAWSLAEISYLTSFNSINGSPNEQRIKSLRLTRKYLRDRRNQTFPEREKILNLAYATLDSGTRYTLGALATLKDSQDKATIEVRCWRANTNTDVGEIFLRETGIKAQIKVTAGKASIIHETNEVEWDENQMASLQDARALPPNARVCMTANGSTFIVATPDAPLQIVSLLWQMSNGKVTLRGWPVMVGSSGGASERGLACIDGTIEERHGAAMFTQVLYRQMDSSGTACDEQNPDVKAAALTFVRGLVTPVPLPAADDPNESNKVVKECRIEPKGSKVGDTVTWSCAGGYGAQPVKIKISGWPTSGTSFAVLSLEDTLEDEISPGSFVVDQAVISPGTKSEDLTLAFECVGDSISLLISNKETRWAYLVGAQAIDDLLYKLQGTNPIPKTLQQGDPIQVMEMMENNQDSMKDNQHSAFWTWIVEAPAKMLGTMSAAFRPSRPWPLCLKPTQIDLAQPD